MPVRRLNAPAARTRPPQLVIYLDVFGGWRWEHFDERGEPRDSRESFDSRLACLIDARRHGLVRRRQIPSEAPSILLAAVA